MKAMKKLLCFCLLFTSMYSYSYGITIESTKLNLKTIKNQNPLVRSKKKILALESFTNEIYNVLENEEKTVVAIDAAEEGMKSDHRKIRNAALTLNKLVYDLLKITDGGKNEVANKAVEKGIKSSHEETRKAARKLFMHNTTSNLNYDEQPYFLDLFYKSAKKDQALEEVAEAITKWIRNAAWCHEWINNLAALNLFEMLLDEEQLFKKGEEIFPEATREIIVTVLSNLDIHERDWKYALNILEKLIEKEPLVASWATDAAVKAIETNASIWTREPSTSFWPSALTLFEKLVEKNQAFEEATKAATQVMENNNWPIKEDALKLFKKLVEKNQAFEEATKAAVKGMEDEFCMVRQAGFELYTKIQALGGETEEIIAPLNLDDCTVESREGFRNRTAKGYALSKYLEYETGYTNMFNK